jgi:WD40 repeat protein
MPPKKGKGKGKGKGKQNTAAGGGSCVSYKERNGSSFIASLLAYPANLHSSQLKMRDLQRSFPSWDRFSFVRNPLSAMPFWLDQFNRLLLTGKGAITMLVVKRLILYPPFLSYGLSGLKVRLATCVLRRFHSIPGTSHPYFSEHNVTHKSPVLSVAFHATTGHLLTGCRDDASKTVNVCNLPTRSVQSPKTGGNLLAAKSVVGNPNSRVFASVGSDGALKIWSISSLDGLPATTCETTVFGHIKPINSVAFHPKWDILATGGKDKIVRLWWLNLRNMSATCAAALVGHSGSVLSVAFNPKGPFLATGSKDGTIKFWQLSDQRPDATCVKTLDGRGGAVNSIAFHPTEPVFAIGCQNGTTMLWQLSPDNSDAICVATLGEHSGAVLSVAFDPSGFFLVTASRDHTAKLWRLSPNKLFATYVATLNGHGGPVNSVAFHPTMSCLVTGGDDCNAKVWK